MARIPEADIERLKHEIAIERLAEAKGIVLKRHGADLIGLCPFHDDHEPSLVISPSKNLWHCLGACQCGGTVIDWTMKSEGVSFRHAVELLRSDPSLVASSTAPVKRSTVTKLPTPVDQCAEDQALLNQVIDYYHETLLQSPEALAYLEKRGLHDAALIARFKLGYANRTLGYRLPEKHRKSGADLRGRLQALGILRDSGHEHFNGSLIVPVFDAAGNVTEVYGRKLLDTLRTGTPKHLYLPGPHRGVWNREAFAASKEIIVCEALLDALTFWCAGYHNVTASYGVEGFTPDHLAALKEHGTQRVLIAYDRDAAGERASQALAAQLMPAGIECFRIEFPKGLDANDYALKVTPASKALGLVIRKAVWLGKGPPPTRLERVPLTVAPVVNIAAAPCAPACAPSVSSSLVAESVAPLPASPVPTMGRDVPVEVRERDVVLTLGEGAEARCYRVRGLAKNLAVDVLKVNLMVSQGEAFHVDTLDLYSAKQRGHYLAQAAQETALDERLLKADLGRVLLALEQMQDSTIQQTLQPAPSDDLNEADRQAALAFLQAPDLLERIVADFEHCGLVGERTNKLVGYLAALSRKLDRPLGVVIQSSSAAGKTTLMDAVLAFVPDEEQVKYSAMTGQSLFYMGETNLKHKALAIVEEEGASRASYALKLLQSEGELTIASTGKDPASGNLITQQYRVEGPVALLVTTTARDLDEELLNRCLVLAVDEGRAQTRAIHQQQRAKRTLDGLLAKHARDRLRTLHRNAQRLLRPLAVLNPYARFLTFPDQTPRLRRDHEKYLTLIDTIALLHQQQRVIQYHGEPAIEYIEVALTDIEHANRLAHDVLGRSLDALPPQTRRLVQRIDGYVSERSRVAGLRRADVRFSRRQLREALEYGDTQLKIHLARLVELEYLVAHRTKTGGFEYELVYETADTDTLRFPGLADIAALQDAYDAARSGSDAVRSGAGRGAVGPRSGGGRPANPPENPPATRPCDESPNTPPKTQCSRPARTTVSYPSIPARTAGG